MKEYKCCICHKVLAKKPIRIVKQEYAIGKYHQYHNVAKYDFCERCFKPIETFINKYNKGGM